MYHSCTMVDDMLSVNDAHYVDEINKWSLVFKAMDGYINVTSKQRIDESISTEANIIRLLEDFDTDTAREILTNVLSTLRYD